MMYTIDGALTRTTILYQSEPKYNERLSKLRKA